jgi:catechol 2,3-dioxygenase-like lactoylglutathione lyase family enzyme
MTSDFILHHVSVPVRDIERATRFYDRVFGFRKLPRTASSTRGVWYGLEDRELHLIETPQGTFRQSARIDYRDIHLALRTRDFDAVIARLKSLGFREDAEEGDPDRIAVFNPGPAGYPQAYLVDPDYNTIEINSAGA